MVPINIANVFLCLPPQKSLKTIFADRTVDKERAARLSWHARRTQMHALAFTVQWTFHAHENKQARLYFLLLSSGKNARIQTSRIIVDA